LSDGFEAFDDSEEKSKRKKLLKTLKNKRAVDKRNAKLASVAILQEENAVLHSRVAAMTSQLDNLFFTADQRITDLLPQLGELHQANTVLTPQIAELTSELAFKDGLLQAAIAEKIELEANGRDRLVLTSDLERQLLGATDELMAAKFKLAASSEQYLQVMEAYNVLRDPEMKRAYHDNVGMVPRHDDPIPSVPDSGSGVYNFFLGGKKGMSDIVYTFSFLRWLFPGAWTVLAPLYTMSAVWWTLRKLCHEISPEERQSQPKQWCQTLGFLTGYLILNGLMGLEAVSLFGLVAKVDTACVTLIVGSQLIEPSVRGVKFLLAGIGGVFSRIRGPPRPKALTELSVDDFELVADDSVQRLEDSSPELNIDDFHMVDP